MDLTPSTAFRAESLAKLPEAMDLLASQPDIHSLVLIVGGLAVKETEISAVFADYWRRCPKAVSVDWPAPTGTLQRFAEQGIATFDEPDQALRALGRLAAFRAARDRPVRLGRWWPPDCVPAAGWGLGIEASDRCREGRRRAGARRLEPQGE
jgi:hypothetical protein